MDPNLEQNLVISLEQRSLQISLCVLLEYFSMDIDIDIAKGEFALDPTCSPLPRISYWLCLLFSIKTLDTVSPCVGKTGSER
jgi:hypothetical protein